MEKRYTVVGLHLPQPHGEGEVATRDEKTQGLWDLV